MTSPQVTVEEARAIVLGVANPIMRTERLPLLDAEGRVLADDTVAPGDVPPFDRAAMDGYAVRAADTSGATPDEPITLQCLEHLAAGRSPTVAVSPRECAAVATGTPMPPGADAVVMVEHTRARGAQVEILQPAQLAQHVGSRGADLQAGRVVARAGARLVPGQIGALAAAGIGEVLVYAKPLVAVFATGSELQAPGQRLSAAGLHDGNTYALAALVEAQGAMPVTRAIVDDSRAALAAALDDCGRYDLLVCSGGTSVGTHDFVLQALAARGTVHFHGVAVKPGKSTACATVDGVPVLALPGYPAACLLNAYALLVPLLQRLTRLPDRSRQVVAPLGRRVVTRGDKHHFSTVRLESGRAVPAFKKAGDVTSVSDAHGYISIERGVAVLEAGTPVTVTLF